MRVVGAGATATYYLVLLGTTYYCAFPAKAARGCENSTAISLYPFNQKKQEKTEVEPLLQDEAVRKKMQTYLNWIWIAWWTGFWFRTPPWSTLTFGIVHVGSNLPNRALKYPLQHVWTIPCCPCLKTNSQGKIVFWRNCCQLAGAFLAEPELSSIWFHPHGVRNQADKKKTPPADSNREAVSLATLGCCSCPGLSSSGHSPSHWPTPRGAPFNTELWRDKSPLQNIERVAPPTQQSSLRSITEINVHYQTVHLPHVILSFTVYLIWSIYIYICA